MAVYILMIKLEDNEKKVVYKFGPNEKHMGIIEFDKKHKVFNVLEKVDDGIVSNEAYENWTAEKIVKLIYKNGANLPDITSVEK